VVGKRKRKEVLVGGAAGEEVVEEVEKAAEAGAKREEPEGARKREEEVGAEVRSNRTEPVLLLHSINAHSLTHDALSPACPVASRGGNWACVG
jgi:hypothetical protein